MRRRSASYSTASPSSLMTRSTMPWMLPGETMTCVPPCCWRLMRRLSCRWGKGLLGGVGGFHAQRAAWTAHTACQPVLHHIGTLESLPPRCSDGRGFYAILLRIGCCVVCHQPCVCCRNVHSRCACTTLLHDSVGPALPVLKEEHICCKPPVAAACTALSALQWDPEWVSRQQLQPTVHRCVTSPACAAGGEEAGSGEG